MLNFCILRTVSFAHMAVNSSWPLMVHFFSHTLYFHASNTLCEVCENMYGVNISLQYAYCV